MQGKEILERQIGKPLIEGKVKCITIHGNPPQPISVTFLLFGNDWIRIMTTDEQTAIRADSEDMNELEVEQGFKFQSIPLDQIHSDFQKFIGKRLMTFKELVSLKTEHFSFGLNLYFEGDMNFIIRNHDYPVDKTEYLFKQTHFEDLREK